MTYLFTFDPSKPNPCFGMVIMDSLERSSRLLLLVLLYFTTHAISANDIDALTDAILTASDEAVKHRLAAMDHDLIEFRDHPDVRGIIRRYVERNQDMSGRIIGRSTRYFPLFERHLRSAKLPEALKYLTITESALVVRAQSRVGATGLWQFMPGTAKEVGLRIDPLVDERLDPERATQGAMLYLERMHTYFEDWALAMAAYNAGPGTVNRAIRRSGSRDFWRLRRFLPSETRMYVPGFIAAAYLAEYYQAHDIQPELPPLDFQLTQTVLIRRPLSFKRIAEITGLSIEAIRDLNPAYRKDLIPGYQRGHYLTVPRRVFPAVLSYLDGIAGQENSPELRYFTVLPDSDRQLVEQSNYRQSVYLVRKGQTLGRIARELGTPAYLLAVWNRLGKGDTLQINQRLRYFEIIDSVHLRRAESVKVASPIISPQLPRNLGNAAVEIPETHPPIELWITTKRSVRLANLLETWPLADAAEVKRLNGLEGNPVLAKGTRVCLSRG